MQVTGSVFRSRSECIFQRSAAPRLLWILGTAVIWLSLAESALAQAPSEAAQLSVSQAVSIALEKNPLKKAALADTRAASAGVLEARSFLMPHITF
jgi:outer membrane protein TolC